MPLDAADLLAIRAAVRSVVRDELAKQIRIASRATSEVASTLEIGALGRGDCQCRNQNGESMDRTSTVDDGESSYEAMARRAFTALEQRPKRTPSPTPRAGKRRVG